MVVREYVECLVCGKAFIVRVGIGIETICAHSFDCPACRSPIVINARTGEPPTAWIEMGENASKIDEKSSIDTYVNLHPSIAFQPDQYRSKMAFASMTYMSLIGSHMRTPANQRNRDAATDFEVPYTREIWPLVSSVLSLGRGNDPAGILTKQIDRYVARRQMFSAGFQCFTVFKTLASFFDDIFYPAIGGLRYPAKAIIENEFHVHQAEMLRFVDYYRDELERPSIDRYVSIFTDYFRYFDQFRQMLVHARVNDENVDDYVVGSKSFDEIKLYYGHAYETLTSSYVVLACVNNVMQGRPFDEFQSMSLTKYIKDVEKAKKSNPFKDVPEFAAFARFEDSALRNGSHHASIWRDGDIVKYKSGGTGAERDISYSRYMHLCNGITIALAALMLVELQMFSRLRPS